MQGEIGMKKGVLREGRGGGGDGGCRRGGSRSGIDQNRMWRVLPPCPPRSRRGGVGGRGEETKEKLRRRKRGRNT